MNAKLSVAAQNSAAQPTLAARPGRPLKLSKTASFDKELAQTDREARRKAAAVLEVLAGARKPSEAAQALGITPMRYYLLEMRAIQGLVKGCEPAKLGPKGSPEREARLLRQQVAQLERDRARYAALARVAQRVVHLSPPPANSQPASGKKARRHKPQVRAVKVLARVQAGLGEDAPVEAQGAAQSEVAAVP
jgi:hypothetical protein